MNEIAHIMTTKAAMVIANRMLGETRFTGTIATQLAAASADVDHLKDIEFVHVRGRQDDPHKLEWLTWDDTAHFMSGGINLTAFNHYIDIKKGPGLFDDYDGYSYARGSAHSDQYQQASQRIQGIAQWTAKVLGLKVDEGISFWLNDEYIHRPGSKWYQKCSPALNRYSYPQDKGVYAGKRTELAARFPTARSSSQQAYGFSDSVFMPVDNLARYWFEQFLCRKPTDETCLGTVLHGVQDASIPQHAAGYAGNWHVEYELALDKFAKQSYKKEAFYRRVEKVVTAWNQHDRQSPTRRLRMEDRRLVPSKKWEIQQLVTWIALQAYHAYAQVYKHFKAGFKVNAPSVRQLYTFATAMSALVLVKAIEEVREKGKKHSKLQAD